MKATWLRVTILSCSWNFGCCLFKLIYRLVYLEVYVGHYPHHKGSCVSCCCSPGREERYRHMLQGRLSVVFLTLGPQPVIVGASEATAISELTSADGCIPSPWRLTNEVDVQLSAGQGARRPTRWLMQRCLTSANVFCPSCHTRDGRWSTVVWHVWEGRGASQTCSFLAEILFGLSSIISCAHE